MDVKEVELCMVVPRIPTAPCFLPLSTFDVRVRNIYMPSVCFYDLKSNENEQDRMIEQAKQGLAVVLVHFYPFAGRLRLSSEGDKRLGIDCNDAGVEWCVAVANVSLEEMGFSQRSSPHFSKLIQRGNYGPAASMYSGNPPPLLSIQMTKFKLGGISLGSSLNHGIGDATAISHFMVSWAEVCRGQKISVFPDHNRAFEKKYKRLATAYEDYLRNNSDPIPQLPLHQKSDLITKTFVFDEMVINRLKRKDVADYSSFVTVTAYLWMVMSAARNLQKSQKSKVYIALDCRNKLVPQLPKGYFGNAAVFTAAEASAGEFMSGGFPFAASIVHRAIHSFGMEDIYNAITSERKAGRTSTVDMYTSGSHKLGKYEHDLGWGNPVTLRNPAVPLQDGLCMFEPVSGSPRSMEVTVRLPTKVMQTFTFLLNELKSGSRL